MSKKRAEKVLLGKAKDQGELARRCQVYARYMTMGHWNPRHTLAKVGPESVKKQRLIPYSPSLGTPTRG